MASTRQEITNETVSAALRAAAAGGTDIHDFADTRIPGFVLRVRGKSVSWLLKTRSHSKKLGAPPQVGVREARRLAEVARAEYPNRKEKAPTVEPEPATSFWTWGHLADRYVDHLAHTRIKRGIVRAPSAKTVSDARLAFSRAALSAWRDRPLPSLTATDLSDAVEATMAAVSYRQACKVLAYVKAALTWALSTNPRESGMVRVTPFWQAMRAPEPTGEQVDRIVARSRPTAVENFGVREVALVLARHEDFCRGKAGTRRISAAVRWGVWWAAITVVRRGAATDLRQSDVVWSDPNVPTDWALVRWPAKIIKARRDFWLPIPPLGVQILRSVRRDWRAAVNKTHGPLHESNWLFPSNRRIGRKHTTRDVALASSSLNTHLESMRGRRKANHRNHLEDLPPFSLHSMRTAATTYLVERRDIADGAASALLGHALPGDSDRQILGLSPVTAAYYNLAQHIPLKIEAIAAWTDALLFEYKNVGGVYPW
jgi:integrase